VLEVEEELCQHTCNDFTRLLIHAATKRMLQLILCASKPHFLSLVEMKSLFIIEDAFNRVNDFSMTTVK
jgi:hypothetical protein